MCLAICEIIFIKKCALHRKTVSYTHLDVYKRQEEGIKKQEDTPRLSTVKVRLFNVRLWKNFISLVKENGNDIKYILLTIKYLLWFIPCTLSVGIVDETELFRVLIS